MKTSEVDIRITIKGRACAEEVVAAIKSQLAVENWARAPQSLRETLADIDGVEAVEVRP